MITVYKYGFEAPAPVVVEQPPPYLTYLIILAGSWWAWKKGWFGGLENYLTPGGGAA